MLEGAAGECAGREDAALGAPLAAVLPKLSGFSREQGLVAGQAACSCPPCYTHGAQAHPLGPRGLFPRVSSRDRLGGRAQTLAQMSSFLLCGQLWSAGLPVCVPVCVPVRACVCVCMRVPGCISGHGPGQ